ncbi:MAG: hypothetical protein U1D68_01685 [Arthrobacter sp.]|nr:hypothetical protein [Arthrobacter sp.]MDZ4353019.1 hypothetical protein [Arthrobacter sp.]
MEVALLDLFSTVSTLMDSLPFDIACQYSLLVLIAARASASGMVAFLSASWTITSFTLISPLRAREYASVAAECCSAPFVPCPSRPWLEVGLLPPTTSVNSGSGEVRVCDSTVAGEAADAVGTGDGVADAVAGGRGVAVDVGVGEAVADVVVGVADVVAGGRGVGLARAGESVTVVSEARVTTNAVSSAVVFRIEFTFCLS